MRSKARQTAQPVAAHGRWHLPLGRMESSGRVGFYGHVPGPSHLTCNGRARRRSAWRSLADIMRAASFHRSRKTSPWTGCAWHPTVPGWCRVLAARDKHRKAHTQCWTVVQEWRGGQGGQRCTGTTSEAAELGGRGRREQHARGAQPKAATAEAVAASATVQRGSDARAPRWQRGDRCAKVPATGTVTMTSLPLAVRPAGFFEATPDLTSRTYRSGAPVQSIPTCQVGFTSCVGPVASVGLVKSENFMCVRPSSPKPTCRSENISSIRPVVQPSDPAGRFLTCQVGF